MPGQFCTNPGLLIGKAGAHLDTFIQHLGAAIQAISPATMLNEKIYRGYESGRGEMLSQNGVNLEGQAEKAGDEWRGCGTVASVSGSDFLANVHLQEEVFGPFTLVVKCADDAEMQTVVSQLRGQLTATVMGEPEEMVAHADLLGGLREKVGRLIFNGVPTGVEVCHSMFHGGPFPATTDSRFTSVGSNAIRRFVRPVAYQSWPQALLPEELKDGNPLGIKRMEVK
ncbi:MAG: hypothetical protein R3C61_15270 [Bacteroidia bacterium]